MKEKIYTKDELREHKNEYQRKWRAQNVGKCRKYAQDQFERGGSDRKSYAARWLRYWIWRENNENEKGDVVCG